MDNNGEQSAFPLDINEGMPQWGLTKREYVAAQALQGLLANPSYADYSVESTVSSAVNFAEALINALNN
ncbi:hypothetical protein GCM10028818_41210 [Spirosoma horti]